MLVLKRKYNKLKDDYNRLVDTKNYWEEVYRESQSKVVRLEQQCNRLYKELDKADDAVVELNFKCETEEKHKDMWFQKFIKTKEELDRVDRIVLQYEQRINELEEKLNETII
jgi:chromosome segregation ATPase